MKPKTPSGSGHRARKRFGQNFLKDTNVIDDIIYAINPQPGERIVEIGPGLGALTDPLLDAAGTLEVVELDRDLVEKLNTTYSGRNLTVHSGDALKFDFSELAGADKLRIVGNLPYNISTPLLFHLMDHLPAVKDIHCMLQKEVIDRLAAGPGEDDYGRLSIMIQYHCRVEKLFTVYPESFTPAPKVHSAVARLVPHETPPIEVHDTKRFAQLVSQSFSQRRKTLRKSLKTLLSIEQIEAAGIDPGARPETLGLAQFAALANIADGS